MTVAVCFHCGAIKFGAFCPCQKCSALPRNEEELALSLAMTDHYFDRPTFERMGVDVARGKPLQLAPETRAQLLEHIRAVIVDSATPTPLW